MRQVQEGDTSQLAFLFERHHLALFRYLLGLSGNRALSEDLVQEVFLRVIKYSKTFNTALSFQVWLYGIARNAYVDSYRKRRHEVADDARADVKSDAPAPEEIVTRKQDTQILQQAFRQLPDDKREVLILSRFHNLRYEDIGRILECETGTVKVRVYRALKELRERFCELSGEKAYGA